MCCWGLTAGVVSHAAVGGGASGEALALPPHCHDELLQADAVHTGRQVRVPALQVPLATSVPVFEGMQVMSCISWREGVPVINACLRCNTTRPERRQCQPGDVKIGFDVQAFAFERGNVVGLRSMLLVLVASQIHLAMQLPDPQMGFVPTAPLHLSKPSLYRKQLCWAGLCSLRFTFMARCSKPGVVGQANSVKARSSKADVNPSSHRLSGQKANCVLGQANSYLPLLLCFVTPR